MNIFFEGPFVALGKFYRFDNFSQNNDCKLTTFLTTKLQRIKEIIIDKQYIYKMSYWPCNMV